MIFLYVTDYSVMLHGQSPDCFLFCILNHAWHFGDERPSHGGIDKVMLLLLIHYRCLSFFMLPLHTGWGLEMKCRVAESVTGFSHSEPLV